MKRCLLALTLASILFLIPSKLFAGGGQAYPLGAEAFFVGMAPPPGWTIVNYMYHYHASSLKDDNGKDIPVFKDVNVNAEVLRIIWITKKKILGGNYGMHIFFPYLDVDLDFNAPVGPKRKKHYSESDMPYIIYSPFIWTFHRKKFHWVFSLVDIYIPLNNEDDDKLTGVGRNYWTFEPVFAFTWIPHPSFEFSMKFMYDFNTEQDDYPTPYGVKVDRDPGQEFHFDWNMSVALRKDLRFGISGFFYKQLETDDYKGIGKYRGVMTPLGDLYKLLKDDENNLSRVWGIGPGIWYHRKNIFLTLRTQFEGGARNKTEGKNVWFKFIYLF